MPHSLSYFLPHRSCCLVMPCVLASRAWTMRMGVAGFFLWIWCGGHGASGAEPEGGVWSDRQSLRVLGHSPEGTEFARSDDPDGLRPHTWRRFRLALSLAPGAVPPEVAARWGLTYEGTLRTTGTWHVFTAPDQQTAERVLAAAQPDSRPEAGAIRSARPQSQITQALPLLARRRYHRLIPNDPLFGQQWHLRQTSTNGVLPNHDIAVTGVWDLFRGSGVRIGVVDDGLELTHPDLAPNIDSLIGHDWNDLTPDDPSPQLSVDFHGTSCAGLVAAAGNNAVGVSGVAPEATLVGLRLTADSVTDAQEAEAISWRNDVIHIKTNSWGPSDSGTLLEAPGPLMKAALADAALSGRAGKGTVLIWAAGNGGAGAGAADNSNYDGYANSVYVAAVGAVTSEGLPAAYSEPGANVLVCAPADGGSQEIATTDLAGLYGYNDGTTANETPLADYTQTFGGTSAATPLVAGVAALMLQARPALSWRDVQEILIRTAKKVDPSHTDWITNGGGLHFNHRLGAGMVQADAAVALAQTWTLLPTMISQVRAFDTLPQTIPDGPIGSVSREVRFPGVTNLRVEHATLRLSITHASRGQLAISLISPSGTVSRLAEAHLDANDHYSDWTFSSVRHWGENSGGLWRISILDTAAGTVGQLQDAELTLYGTPGPPIDEPPVFVSAQLHPATAAYTDQGISVLEEQATDAEGQPITYTYQWQESADGKTYTALSNPPCLQRQLPAFRGRPETLVRCQIIPRASGIDGLPGFTPPVALNRRPPQAAVVGQPYSYDSDLFIPPGPPPFVRSVIINEVSQGPSGSKEWIELLTLKTVDLRGWTLEDRQAPYVTFATAPLWQSIPGGTLIVIHNGVDKDPLLGPTDADPSDSLISLPHNHAAFVMGGTWGGLSNSSSERVVLREPNAQVHDGLSFNNDGAHDAKLGNLTGGRHFFYQGDTEAGVDLVSGWVNGPASQATPLNANTTANADLRTQALTGGGAAAALYRWPSGYTPPGGLNLDPASGTVSGVPSAAGIVEIRLERFTSASVVGQNYLLHVADPTQSLTDADADGLTAHLEWRLGLDPHTPSTSPLSWRPGEKLTFSVPAGLALEPLALDYSTDLITWLSWPMITLPPSIMVEGDTKHVTFDLNALGLSGTTTPRIHMRLRAL